MGHELSFTGNNYGQIVNGDNNTVTLTVHGDYIVNNERSDRPRPLPTPVYIRPKSFPDLLDRVAERKEALASVARNMTVELCGAPGLGKTAMLRHISNVCTGDYCADGVIYIDGRGRPPADILQFVFDAFHEYEVPYKPTDAELARALGNKRALIVVDDLQSTDDEFRSLANKLPNATFLVASEAGCLVQEVDNVDLHGLPFDDSVTLMERELRHPLAAEERAPAHTLWESCKGNPAALVALACEVRRASGTLQDAAAHLAGGGAPDPDALLDACTDGERRVLTVLAFFGDAYVAAKHIAELAGSGVQQGGDAMSVPSVESVLRMLEERHLVEQKDDGWALVPHLVEPFRGRLNHSEAGERALEYVARYVAAQWPESASALTMPAGAASAQAVSAGGAARGWSPLSLLPDSAAILRTLEFGIASGRWKEALAIAPAIEAALTLAGRWEARAAVIGDTLKAANHGGNDAAKAWALHQRGSLALCTGDRTLAQSSLEQALALRKSMGDERGALITAHNLERLAPAPGGTGRNPRRLLQAAGVLAVAFLAWLFWPSSPIPAPFALEAAWMPDTSGVHLSWTDRSEHRAGVRLERSTPGGSFAVIATLDAGIATHADLGVRPGGTYIYRAQAFIGERTSDYSNLDTVSVPAGRTPPAADTVHRDSTRRDSTHRDSTHHDSLQPPPAVPTLTAIVPDSARAVGGSTVGASIMLSAPARTDAGIMLTAEPKGSIEVQPSAVVVQGQVSTRITLRTVPVERRVDAVITATWNGTSRRVIVALYPPALPPRLIRISTSTTTIPLGTQTSFAGSVSLDRPALAGGMRVELASTNPKYVVVSPASVNIPAGSTTAGFKVVVTPVPAPELTRLMVVRAPKVVLTATDPVAHTVVADTLTFIPRQPPKPVSDCTSVNHRSPVILKPHVMIRKPSDQPPPPR
ncbi:MAG TPA: NB-ARC domain-containing protein [Candidatus Kapabacteria bacterium]|nr:NB-ARC domain-containing protein [Candidatus Kapabacteria bacterium]